MYEPVMVFEKRSLMQKSIDSGQPAQSKQADLSWRIKKKKCLSYIFCTSYLEFNKLLQKMYFVNRHNKSGFCESTHVKWILWIHTYNMDF